MPCRDDHDFPDGSGARPVDYGCPDGSDAWAELVDRMVLESRLD